MSEAKYRNRDWLENEMQNKTITEISEECSVTTACISKWKRKFDLGSDKMITCPVCDGEFISIGNHWTHNPDHRPRLTQRQKEITVGILMSDGCINRESKKKPRLQVYMTNEKYLEYLDNVFGILSTGVYDHITAEKLCKSNHSFSTDIENTSDVYRCETRGHPQFEEFADWYSTGEKVFPSNIDLTGRVLKHWYCGDGSLDQNKENISIRISCCNENGNEEKLQEYFAHKGFSVSNFNHGKRENGSVKMSLQFTDEISREIFEYMGEPLPGFEYKWPDN